MTPDQLLAWRQRQGWTQQQAADGIGVSKRHLQYQLSGGREFEIRTLQAMRWHVLVERLGK